MNLGSLLPARCCRKAHVSTGSSSCSVSSSDSYIVIKSLGVLRLWVFLITFLLLGIDKVIADEGLFPSGFPCPRVGLLDASPPQAPSLLSPLTSLELYPFMVVSLSAVLLVTMFRVVSSGCVSEMALVGVPRL